MRGNAFLFKTKEKIFEVTIKTSTTKKLLNKYSHKINEFDNIKINKLCFNVLTIVFHPIFNGY